MVSVIIPVFNEEKILSQNNVFFSKLSQKTELIFVNGASTDKSAESALRFAPVLDSAKGRARQMNVGARGAKGDILLFLHADTKIHLDALGHIEEKLKDENVLGGCLSQRIDKGAWAYRWIESFGNIRAGLTKVFYGDQGIFIRADVFAKLGGFDEVPLMEDVLMSKKMRAMGETVVLKDEILVSPRRWEKKGIIRTIIFYSSLNILFWLRFPLRCVKKSTR